MGPMSPETSAGQKEVEAMSVDIFTASLNVILFGIAILEGGYVLILCVRGETAIRIQNLLKWLSAVLVKAPV